MRRRPLRLLWLAVVVWLASCASLPDISGRAATHALAPPADAPLVRLAQASVPAGSPSAFRLLAAATYSLQARLALIERAHSSIDLQYYIFRGDETGRMLMHALQEAAARGVRVRLLIDDLYTAGEEELLLGLAAHEGVQVRLFNPFPYGRTTFRDRLAAAFFGSETLHRRMHNKLFVVDGAFAIAGGRNVADAYFMRAADHGFVDFDVLAAGAVVAELGAAFDPYWNSEHTYDARMLLREAMPAAERRQRFAAQVAGLCSRPECIGGPEAQALPVARPPLLESMSAGRLEMVGATAQAMADDPEKIHHLADGPASGQDLPPAARVRMAVASAIRQTQRELVVVSPYLIPGRNGVEALRRYRERGVEMTLLTNSLAATDEPLAHVGYRRYRNEILHEGVQLFEWSPVRSGRVFRQILRVQPTLRLHAKCALIDRRVVYLGSMNFDPRSRDLNTELGLLIHSPALANEIHALIEQFKREASYRVTLADDGYNLLWVSPDGTAAEAVEPETDVWSRLLLQLLGPFVPDEVL